jgi:hypothetical protein
MHFGEMRPVSIGMGYELVEIHSELSGDASELMKMDLELMWMWSG